MTNVEYLPVKFKLLTPGQQLIKPDAMWQAPRTVKKVEKAMANGYIVVLFQDGTRSSVHGDTEAYVISG